MDVLRRPLTGMISSGVAAPRAIDNVTATVLHTVDVSATGQGGPYVDLVTLFVENTTGGSLDLTLTVLSGTPMTITIASKSTVKVLDEVPFQTSSTSSGTATQVRGQGSSAGLVFYGYFARPL